MAFKARVRLDWSDHLPLNRDVEAAFRKAGATSARAASADDGTSASIVTFEGTARQDAVDLRAQTMARNAVAELGEAATIGPIDLG